MAAIASSPDRADTSGAWRTRGTARLALAAVFLLALAASVMQYAGEFRARARLEDLVESFQVVAQHSEDVQTMRVATEIDFAWAIFADAALRHLVAEAPKSVPSPGSGGSGARPRELLEAARKLVGDAIARRPSWGHHAFLLGRLTRATAQDRSGAALSISPETWIDPLIHAAAAAPGLDVIWRALSASYLESWGDLSNDTRSRAPAVFRRAFYDSNVVSRDFARVLGVVGPRAYGLLPEDAGALAAGLLVARDREDIHAQVALWRRWERAKRRERAEQLARLERRHRLGDVDALRAGCLSWAATHPAGEFDDATGRAQAARVLEIWPPESGGWTVDPRADLVRFFLNGREAHVRPAVLLRVLESLSEVPASLLARVRLAAGDREGAQQLAEGVPVFGSREWTPYFVQRARLELQQGGLAEARRVLDALSPSEAEDCEVLLARRAVAQASGNAAEAQMLLQKISTAGSMEQEFGEWSVNDRRSLCLERPGVLVVVVEAVRPTVISYGWDGGRAGSAAIRNSAALRVSSEGLNGQRSFTVTSESAGRVRIRSARVLDGSVSSPRT